MKDDWLTATNLDFSISALSAINVLSIHYKFKLANKQNPTPTEKIENAKKRLVALSEQLEKLSENQTIEADTPVLGTDRRLGEFALQYTQQARKQSESKLRAFDHKKLERLLNKPKLDEIELLIEYLDELRNLVEQYASTDFDWVWGNL